MPSNISDGAQNPILVIVRGVPGSGKTYFSAKLTKHLPNGSYVVLDPDATDYNSTEYQQHVKQQLLDGVDEKLHPYRFLRAKAYKAIESDQIIIWNQPFTDLDIMKKVTDRIQSHGPEVGKILPMIVLEIEVPKTIAWQRIVERKKLGGHGPSGGRFDKFYDEYISAKQKGYETITISGQLEPDQYISKVIDMIAIYRQNIA